MKSERDIKAEILRELGSRTDTRLFNQPVGIADLATGGKIRFGLCPGSADLIGWHEDLVPPEMVGQKLAVFLSIEVKNSSGRVRPEQKIWKDAIDRSGGIAGICRSKEDAVKLISKNTCGNASDI